MNSNEYSIGIGMSPEGKLQPTVSKYLYKAKIGVFRFEPRTRKMWHLATGEAVRASVAVQFYLRACDYVPEIVARAHAGRKK